MLSLVLLLLVAADAAPPPPKKIDERPRLILLDLASSGLDAKVVGILTDTLSTALTHGPFAVTSASDLRVVSNLEADKQMAGCTDTSACEAELASALGADVLVHGSVGVLGDDIIVNLAMYDSNRNTAIAREKVQSKDIGRLNTKLEGAAARMIALYEGREPIPDAPESSLGTTLLVAGGVVGVVGVVVGVIGGLNAASGLSTLQRPDSSGADKASARDGYPTQTAMLIGGGVVAVVGVGAAAASLLVE